MDPQTSSTEILDEVRFHRSLFPDRRSKPEDDYFIIRLPGTEIPKWLNLNHESDGNVISFWVGRTFPNIFDVCFAFGPVKYSCTSSCYVYLSINGCKKEHLSSTPTQEFSDNLWIFSLSNNEMQNRLNKSNPSEQNYFEVTCKTEDWVKNPPRRWGVRVECICCSQKSDVFQLPSSSATHCCGSSSVPLLPTSSCGTDMDQRASIMEEILDIGQEETIDHPMPDVPKNTTCPTSDGFESDIVSGNGALVQPEFQLQRSSSGTFFLLLFFIHSLFGKPKKMKQTKFCVLFWKLKGSNKGIGRDRSQVFQQWRRRFSAFKDPHFCQ